MHSVVAIVVTFNPDTEVLNTLLKAIESQVSSVIIVDNGSPGNIVETIRRAISKNGLLIEKGFNSGIAEAINTGITEAQKLSASHIILFDQDSIPAPDMVDKLLAAMKIKNGEKVKVAAVGPRYTDERQDDPRPPFIRVRGLKLERWTCATKDTVVPVDYLISSGCLVSMSALNEIGGMRDDLFIDYVDIEWGLRARHHGFQSYGVCSACMQHSLGDQPIKFVGKNIPLHIPIRHYYHFRNAVLLYKESWVPLNWKLVDGWRLCLKYGFYLLFAKPHLTHWRMMTLGVWHGFLGKGGEFVPSYR